MKDCARVRAGGLARWPPSAEDPLGSPVSPAGRLWSEVMGLSSAPAKSGYWAQPGEVLCSLVMSQLVFLAWRCSWVTQTKSSGGIPSLSTRTRPNVPGCHSSAIAIGIRNTCGERGLEKADKEGAHMALGPQRQHTKRHHSFLVLSGPNS